ncbi:MAG: TolC family protein [Paludibacteraceae bacterium]|nr:TolC family protein [Paludibacteraceae bacterium]MBP9970906.1 TolC family protein [Paludibacteraceae bacterium]
MKKLFVCLVLLVSIVLQVFAQKELFSLDDCRNMAMSNNKELKIAHEQVKVAVSLEKAAFTHYFPTISANGAYLWNEKNISLMKEDAYLPVYAMDINGSKNYAASWNNSWAVYNGAPVPLDANGVPFDPQKNPEKISWKNYAYLPKDAFEMDVHNVFVGSVMMAQPLFMGGKIRELNNIAKSTRKISEAKFAGELSDNMLETDAAYWRVVSLVNKEKLAKSYVALLEKLSSDVEKSILFGVATKSEALSVKVKLNEAQMQLLQVQDGLNLSKMLLCQLCGLPLDSDFGLVDENIATTDMPLDNPTINIDNAVANRYEIKSLEETINIAESNRKIMVSRFMPNAALTAGYLLSNPNIYNGFSTEFAGMWQVGVVVNVPIFHFGERIHTLNAARSIKQIAEYELEDAKEKIRLEITQSSFKMNEVIKKSIMTKTNKDKAEENLRYATIGFDSGVVASSVVMEAQTAWLKANSEDVDARIEVKLCQLYLQKAIGNLK